MTTVCGTTNDCDYCVWDNRGLRLLCVRQLGVGTTGCETTGGWNYRWETSGGCDYCMGLKQQGFSTTDKEILCLWTIELVRLFFFFLLFFNYIMQIDWNLELLGLR